MKKSKNFLLLEILIAVSLLSLFSFFFITMPYRALRAERKELKKIDSRLEADEQFAKLLVKVYNQDGIKWDDLEGKDCKLNWDDHTTLVLAREKKLNDTITKRVDVTVKIDKMTSHYAFVWQKKPKSIQERVEN